MTSAGPAKIPELGQALGKTAKSVKAAAEVRIAAWGSGNSV